MIRVMIVDDEPFIRQGLMILIHWEQYGFSICGEASNGKEAIERMKGNAYDLIITDIKMPQMDGLELIAYTWEHISNEIRFIILSGFYEFEYAKKAIKYDVADYVLKPVQREELIRALEDYKEQYNRRIEKQKKMEFSEKIVFDRHISRLIAGKQDKESFAYAVKYLADYTSVRYISLDYDTTQEQFQELSEEEKRKAQSLLYDTLKEYLKGNWYHAYIDSGTSYNDYAVGFIYAKKLSVLAGVTEKEWITSLYDFIRARLSYKIVLYIGQKVDDIRMLSDSYKSAHIAKSFQLFSDKKDIAYYDEIEGSLNPGKYPFDKVIMDDLIRAIEENDTKAIDHKIKVIYNHFKELVSEPEIIKINLDYLRFNLINLAKELNPEFDQAEVYRIINQGSYHQIAVRGSVKHFKNFALEFSDYLNQLRQYALGGVLTEIEKEITENYRDNLSLKYLSEKYYINSAYLGQIFKKQYGISFKDYLNNYRIDRAAELLIRTDDKVYMIANAVGFNNTDYFISKFVQLKGVTPLQYRKQVLKSR